jgi:hypothetical protein
MKLYKKKHFHDKLHLKLITSYRHIKLIEKYIKSNERAILNAFKSYISYFRNRVNKYQKLLRMRKFEELRASQKKEEKLEKKEKKEKKEENSIISVYEELVKKIEVTKEINIIKGFLNYSFDYIGCESLTEDLINRHIPIITYEYFEILPRINIIGNHILVEVETRLKELSEYPNDFGITFNKEMKEDNDNNSKKKYLLYDFFNGYTNNLMFISSENCPFSRLGNQFSNLNDLTILNTFIPYFLPETSLSNCFYNTLNFNSCISNWNTSNVNNMSHMFDSSLMFNNGELLKDIYNLDATTCNYVDISKTLNCPGSTFHKTLRINDILMIRTSTQIYPSLIQRIKSNTSLIFLIPLGIDLNEGEIIEIKLLEQCKSPLNWDTSNVTDMSWMFHNTPLFNQPINYWNISKVTNMSHIFYNAKTFNQNISNWNTTNVKNMSSMFNGAIYFNNGELSGASNNPLNFDLTNCLDLQSMFEGCSSFNQYIGNWEIKNIQNMKRMFKSCKLFNQNIGNWNIENVENISEIFNFASSFNNGEEHQSMQKLLPLLSTYIDINKTLTCPGANFTKDLSNNDILILNTYTNKQIYIIIVENILDDTRITSVNNIGIDLNVGNIISVKKFIKGSKPLSWNITNMELNFNEAISFSQNIFNVLKL